MGLVKGEDNSSAILSDIQGIEDFYGDMDFKVAGTENGITALQMDIKIKGITLEVIKDAINQAREGRLHILGIMLQTIPESREALSKAAPKITTFRIPKEKIGEVIGPGGKNVKSIKEEFGLEEIDINDHEGEGIVSIVSTDADAIAKAKERIEGLLKSPDDISIGEEFMGSVVNITNYGAFINLFPGIDGLLHISKIANKRIQNVEDFLKIGDKIAVKVSSVDSRTKKIGLERTDI
jgi:polyribonucleotide nucleotidyltransferase